MLFALDVLIAVYYTAAIGMSFALNRYHPELSSLNLLSRSMAWPVTVYEVKSDLI